MFDAKLREITCFVDKYFTQSSRETLYYLRDYNLFGKVEEGNVELDNKIETLRMKMLALADETNSLCDERVVRLSVELDVLIVHRQRMMRKQGHLRAA